MPPDWPDESDGPPDRSDGPLDGPDGHPDRRDDNSASIHPTRPAHPESEPPSRQEAYVSLRLAVSTEQTTAAHQTTATEHAAAEKWNKDAQESRWMWSEYERRWPEQDRPQVDRSDDPPDSWRGEGERYFEPEVNDRVEAICDRIARLEQDKITPAMHALEEQNPDRHLVGFEHRLKDRDRIKEKVFDRIDEFGISPEEAIASVSDTTRYTFEYREARYTEDVWADMRRLKECGFKLYKLKNAWSDEEYKGINSQWIAPDSGQRFEVQFHTRISFEAKQLTHDAYEHLRSRRVDEFEKMVLKAFEKKVSADIPIPPGATDIPDYPEGA